MKKLVFGLLILLLTTSCVSKVKLDDGKMYDCTGIDEDNKLPNIVYKPHAMNIFIAIVFFEMIFPPVDVIVNEFKCPVRFK